MVADIESGTARLAAAFPGVSILLPASSIDRAASTLKQVEISGGKRSLF
jgi:hypothetical protein